LTNDVVADSLIEFLHCIEVYSTLSHRLFGEFSCFLVHKAARKLVKVLKNFLNLSVGQVFDVFATDGLAFSVENDVKIRFICLHEFPDIVEELILQHLLFI